MKKLVIGILAHVDAGKTTLSEALLYCAGCLKKLGRVDHQNAFLDTDALERERGITIFSKQAVLAAPGLEIQLLDTPGHVDLSGEMERTLQVLDYAILVINGSDGVQSHTQTLWRLLERYRIPVFLFVNKMDLAGADRSRLLAALQARLGDGCVDFTPGQPRDAWLEAIAMHDEDALAQYLDTDALSDVTVARLAARRKIFPVCFGSALKLEGVEEFLRCLEVYTVCPAYPDGFGATVYKIARDPQGVRLTYLKVTGGSLKVKEVLSGRCEKNGDPWQEKADQLRVYSGARFHTVEEAPAGTICAVTGLTRTWPGQGLGAQPDSRPPVLEPVLTYRVLLPEGCDAHAALGKFRQLEEEDPQLHVVWSSALQEIHVQLMGEVQLEVLRCLLATRFGLQVDFGEGSVVYKETIAGPVEGIGHFEPLRHYAEVHLLLEPGAPGTGLHFASSCPEDMLDRSWQRLILTHLAEKEHVGVLTGSPVTDLKITLTAGRAHLKHTEGGDFRQATYRAVRQGLMQAESVLLEPWYDLRLELPPDAVGRAMADIQRMGGSFEPPQTMEDCCVLTGCAPAAAMRGYPLEVTGYTRGMGRVFCTPAGHRPCHNAQEVIASIGYDCERDTENPADSVFCSHGAGYTVRWDEVPAHAHVDSGLRLRSSARQTPRPPMTRESAAPAGPLEEDAQLAAIFERTYGPSRRRELFRPAARPAQEYRYEDPGPEYLLVDGYNIIYAWDDLSALAKNDLAAARQALADILCNYQGFRGCRVILVFDAYQVRGNPGEVTRYHNIHIVYTKEAETADMYIEKTTYELAQKRRVKVATSDGMEQLIILGHGALRLSAQALREEVELADAEIRRLIEENNRKNERFGRRHP